MYRHIWSCKTWTSWRGSWDSKNTEKEKAVDISSKAKVVGKISKTSKKKESIAYGGYDKQLEVEQAQAQTSINYAAIDTVGALFITIAREYNLKHTDEYLKQFAKKINTEKKISSMAQSMVLAIQDSINTYLMNMANREVQETWIKYRVK